MKKIITIFLSLTIVGCTWGSRDSQTGEEHCSGWSSKVRSLADNSWKFAQLSQNVYANDYDFDLKPHFEIVEEFDRPDISYYAAIFKGKKSNDYVFVYRGTDSFEDFKTGNNPFKKTQNEMALKDVKEAIEKYSINKFTVVGHSFGGGIAAHVSLNIENATLFTFNGSPVYEQENDKYHNDRFNIVERGMTFLIVRALAPEPDKLYTSIECTIGNPIEEHSMKKLAICLTRISAVNDNAEALESLAKNGVDTKWCEYKYKHLLYKLAGELLKGLPKILPH